MIQKALLGFASGVMIAASVWSLLIPAMDMSESMGKFAFAPAAAGLMVGILFLLLLDKTIPHLHLGSNTPEGRDSKLRKNTMLVLAVTLHNIPEGMAVGGGLCRHAGRQQRYYHGQRHDFGAGNRHSKFPGGSHRVHAVKE